MSIISEKLEDIRNYLDVEVHPVVSPDRWDVYAALCDMVDDIIALLKAQEPIEARLNLCDSCTKLYPECDATADAIEFGCGVGNDNVIGCMAYVNRWKAQEPTSTPEAEWHIFKGRRGATCSYCKRTFYDVYDMENYDYYCRHCGARMVRIRTVK